jgi:hypothetical protein
MNLVGPSLDQFIRSRQHGVRNGQPRRRRAAKTVTTTILIVFVIPEDPVATELVAS